jgi:hypothetical protein
MSHGKIPTLSLWALLAVTATACGSFNEQRAKAPDGVYGSSTQLSQDPVPDAERNFRCPDSPNAKPDYDRDFDGSGFYRVCPSLVSPYDVLIRGKTHSSDTICVWPAEYINQGTVYLKPDRPGGTPQVSCYNIHDNPNGVLASFLATRYNSVFVVEGQYKDQMAACLPGGNYFLCPPYSFGKFR